MAKSKKPTRRREASTGRSAPQQTAASNVTSAKSPPANTPNASPPLAANPPRPNVALLITSLVLLAVWLIFLVTVALTV